MTLELFALAALILMGAGVFAILEVLGCFGGGALEDEEEDPSRGR